MRSLAAVSFVAVAALAACTEPPQQARPPQQGRPAAPVDPRPLGVRNLAEPRPGLWTSGQPTAEQFEGLAAAGVRRVVCLRPADEPGTGFEEVAAARRGITFVRLPIRSADDLTADNARALDFALTGGDGATLVACGSSNRVGALLALRAFHVEGQTAADALAFGRTAGLAGLGEAVAERLK
jgi:protein tyrosine phosphatase (PTP) superfamily phosphohydrolase (DUF442 family)